MSSNNENQPGLVGGHVEYIKGAAESVIGNVTGSQAWKASGEQDKAHAVHSMQQAGEKRDPNSGYGKAEEVAGKLTGCDGMVKEGSQTKTD